MGSERLGGQGSTGPGRVQGRQGAGRVQGHGTEGRAGLQDSILRFSRPENLKNHVFATFEKKGEGRAGQGLGSERLGAGQHRARAKARAKGRAGCRAGRAQAGCRGSGTYFRSGYLHLHIHTYVHTYIHTYIFVYM